MIVKPETVIAWHRRGFLLYWTWKSRHPQGRPSLSREVIYLIRRMSLANPRWGAPRIHGELLKLGFELSEATVAKYMVRHRKPPRKPGALNRPMKDKVCSCLVCSSALLVFFSSFPEFEFNSFSLLLFPFLRGGSCVCFSPPVRCHLNPSFFERRAASEK